MKIYENDERFNTNLGKIKNELKSMWTSCTMKIKNNQASAKYFWFL